jgi:hypothetical protein
MLNAAALAFTVKVVVLEEDGLATQPVLFIILFIVNVVEPAVVSKLDGMVNVPFDAPIVNTAVCADAVLAPLSVKVTVYVPAPNVLLFTVAVELTKAHTLVADGEVKLLRFGKEPTTNAAVLPVLGLDVQKPDVTPVTVTLIAPADVNKLLGILNVPDDELIVIVAVLPDEVFAPLKL